MARRPRSPRSRTTPAQLDWSALNKFAVSLEKGNFNDYVELLQNSRRLLWKSFLQGLARGFGAIVGATLVVALLVAILTGLGKYLPGDAGEFFRSTKESIQNQAN